MQIGDIDPNERQRHGRTPGCCTGMLAAFLFLFFGIYQILNLTPSISVPTQLLPADNGYKDLISIALAASKLKHRSPIEATRNRTSPELSKDVMDCAIEAEPLVLQLRALIVQRRPLVTPPVRTLKDVMRMDDVNLRILSSTLQTCAEYALAQGRLDECIEILLDGIEMNVAISQGRSSRMLFQPLMSEAAIEARLDEQVSRLNPAQLAHVAERLDRIRSLRALFADAVLEEGYSQTALYQEAMSGSGQGAMRSYKTLRNLVANNSDESLTWSQRRQLTAYLFTAKSTILNENLEYFKHVATELRLPYSKRKKVAVPGNLLAKFEITSLGTEGGMQYVDEAMLEVLRTETALYRYRAAFGVYPGSLQELCPAYLQEVPRDPLGRNGDEPLRYARRGSAILLYSIGLNRLDDHGVPNAVGFGGAGDIVAGKLLAKKQTLLLPKGTLHL